MQHRRLLGTGPGARPRDLSQKGRAGPRKNRSQARAPSCVVSGPTGEPGPLVPALCVSVGQSPSRLARESRGHVLTVDISLPDVEELQKLVQDGVEKGFLTYDEIVSGLEDVELSKEQVEDFYTYLIDHGVELLEG